MNNEIKTMMRDILDRLKILEQKVDQLNGTKVVNVAPLKFENGRVETIPTIGPKAICQRCGLDLSKTMGYVCPQFDCPSQMKVT